MAQRYGSFQLFSVEAGRLAVAQTMAPLSEEAMLDCGPEYYPVGSLVPESSWEDLSALAINALLTKHDRYESKTAAVSVVKVADSVLRPLYELGVSDLISQDEAARFSTLSEVKDGLSGLVQWSRQYLEEHDDFRIQGISVRKPGLLTTTVDRSQGSRIGLHIDSWDGVSFENRAMARERMNINLGSGSRYLLLADCSIQNMYSEMLQRTPRNLLQALGATGIAREFLRGTRAVPVYRLQIRPGEAYVASTQSILHDSTTLLKNEPDVSFTVVGHFRFATRGGPN